MLENGMLEGTRDGQILQVYPFEHDGLESYIGEFDPPQGWYSPEFGIKYPRSSFSLSKTGSAPFFFGYLIAIGKVGKIYISYSLGKQEEYEIIIDNCRWSVSTLSDNSSLQVRQGEV